MNNKLFFHYLSYFQYPFLFGLLYFVYKLNSGEFNISTYLENMNNIFVLAGLAFSFSTLQDTEKVSIKIEKKIWENPKLGKLFLRVLIAFTLSILIFGIFGYFFAKNENVKEVSFGVIVLGVGLISLTKTGIEIFENHRKDKKIEK